MVVNGKADKRRTSSQKGFTLVELMIAIALIAILATIAAPAFLRYAINANLKSATRDITSDFLLLKERAISENVMYRIVFNVAGNNYTIWERNVADTAYINPQTKTPISFGSDISFSGATAAFKNPGVTFQTRGTVTAGNVALINSRGSTATIRVNITGRTYVQFNMQ